MPVDLSVDGADKLQKVARALKEVGDKDLRKELYRGINRATKPLKQDVKAAALASLPSRGGLNRFVASSKLSTSTRTGGANVGVRITGVKSGHDLRAIDRGRLRHPVFGNPSVWVSQAVTPGWFTRTLEGGAPLVRRELVSVLDRIAEEIARRG